MLKKVLKKPESSNMNDANVSIHKGDAQFAQLLADLVAKHGIKELAILLDVSVPALRSYVKCWRSPGGLSTLRRLVTHCHVSPSDILGTCTDADVNATASAAETVDVCSTTNTPPPADWSSYRPRNGPLILVGS